jgi:esterase
MHNTLNVAYRKMGNGEPLLILHGLFGSSDNWQTLAKSYAEHYEVYLIDQRNHGHAPHLPTHTYNNMSEDVFNMVTSLGLEKVSIIGHSMGGKTAMYFAQQHPEYLHKLVIADMGVKAYPRHHDLIFTGIKAVDVKSCDSRKTATERLSAHISDVGTQQFLLKNLYWQEPGVLAWRFNAEVLEQEIDEVLKPVTDTPVNLPTLFIRGGKSDYIKDDEIESIRLIFSNAHFATIAGAGHWLHAEKPNEFLEKTLAFLRP